MLADSPFIAYAVMSIILVSDNELVFVRSHVAIAVFPDVDQFVNDGIIPVPTDANPPYPMSAIGAPAQLIVTLKIAIADGANVTE